MPTEMQTNPTEKPRDQSASDLDPKALEAIRSLLDTEPEVAPKAVAERRAERDVRAQAGVEEPAHMASEDASEVSLAAKGRSKWFKKPAAEARQPKASAQGGVIGNLRNRILQFRPTPKLVVLTSLALLVLFRPGLMIGLFFINIFVLIGVFLVLGYDGFWRRAMGLARWYAKQRPSRAAEMHRKLDAFALRWDSFLDRFPEGTVDGLYLPDFADLSSADARHDAALDRRLSSISQGDV